MNPRIGDPVHVPYDGRQALGHIVQVDLAHDRVKVGIREVHTRKWYPLADVRPA